MSALDAAIRLGELEATKVILLKNRERRQRWRMYRIRAMVRRWENAYALELIEQMLEELTKAVEEDMQLDMGPSVMWVHALHQVTGLFALKGGRMSEQDREQAKTLLRKVVAEMEDDQNWVQLQGGSGPRGERRR